MSKKHSDATFKRLTLDDHELLLRSDAFDHAVRSDQAQQFLNDPACEIIAAIIDDEIIGFASGIILLHPDKAPAFFVSEVGVNEPYQRQGIASELVVQLLDRARERGCEGIWLATEGDNMPAQGLYKKLKARETRDIVVYDWDGAMDD